MNLKWFFSFELLRVAGSKTVRFADCLNLASNAHPIRNHAKRKGCNPLGLQPD